MARTREHAGTMTGRTPTGLPALAGLALLTGVIAIASAPVPVLLATEADRPEPAKTQPAKAETAEAPAPSDGTEPKSDPKPWAYTSPVRPEVPTLKDAARVRNPVDAFLLARLERAGLGFAPEADPVTLLRRVHFDLTGLPPSAAEIEAFLKDDRSDAFERVVDKLLASPRYGERWAQHWLDLVRYAETNGFKADERRPNAWRYRDWVVDSLNADKPYDRFLHEQLAGDEMFPDSVEARIATGFLRHYPDESNAINLDQRRQEILNDITDTVSSAVLGLTLGCARCHDHKFDPLGTADYYGLAGIFFSSRIIDSPGAKTAGTPVTRIVLATAAQQDARKRHAARLAELEKSLQQLTERHHAEAAAALLPRTADYLTAAWERRADGKTPPAEFAKARGLHEGVLAAWVDVIGRPAAGDAGDGRLLTTAVRDTAGRAGLHAWRGKADCPNVVVNTTDAEQAVLTFKLPARSVAVHPGPTGPVGVVWKSPVTGRVSISGRVQDADKVCGDGVAWRVEAGDRVLAKGTVANGAAADFAGGALDGVEIRSGERVRLVILPGREYTCDTTVVDLRITDGAGGRGWDLRRDLVRDPLEGNPHSDDFGNKDTWSVTDMAGLKGRDEDGVTLPPEWHKAVAAGDAAAVRKAAEAFAATFRRTDAGSPFRIRKPADEATLLPEPARRELAGLRAQLDKLRKSPPPPVDEAHGIREGGVPGTVHAGFRDARIHIRGRYDRLGDTVPRRFPSVLADGKPAAIPAGSSGRLELARWIARPEHPLTARVMVNRIWQHHFGAGLVRTPSNFGKLGERPTHPELLDLLADRFVREGWSVKAMHRAILMSAAYRQSTRTDAESRRTDPDNRLVGRMSPRRLEAEALRDAMLVAAGTLDRTAGGPAFRDFATPRRTLYSITIRSDRSGFGPLFDAADPTAMVDVRTVSIVAPQSLFLMNHPFVLRQTEALAARLLKLPGDDAARLDAGYRLLYGRPPSEKERDLGLAYLAGAAGGVDGAKRWFEYAQVLLSANEFVFVD